MDNFDYWYEMNKNSLIYLYNKLFIISKAHGVDLVHSETTFENYITMMYESCNKKIIFDNNPL